MNSKHLCKVFLVLVWLINSNQSHGQTDNIYVSGSISLSTQIYGVDGIEARKPGNTYAISGRPTLHIGEFSIPLFFIFSNFQRQFRQPFNQFGISPTYKNMKFHLGHSNANWSRYSLGGHRFFGYGGEGNIGPIRLGFVKGNFLRAIERDSISAINGLKPGYSRNGYAAKLGISNKQSFVDLIFFKSSDDISSVSNSEINSSLKPSDNLVAGLKAEVLIKKDLSITMDGGISSLTRDSRFQNLMNDSTSTTRLISRIADPNLSTQFNAAGDAAFRYRTSKYGFDFRWRYIEPGYTSHGTYFMRTDINQKSLGAFIRLAQGKLSLSSRIGFENDNVKLQKLNTTNRTIFSANLTLIPVTQASINVQYSNFGISQNGVLTSISDTTRLDNISRSLVINPNLNFSTGRNNHNLNLLYSNQTLNDNNRFTSQFTELTNQIISINYSINLSKLGFTGNAGYNWTQTEILVGMTNSAGFSGGVSKRFMKNKMNASVNYLYNTNQFEEVENGNTSRLSATINWTTYNQHQLRLQFFQLSNNSLNSQVSRSFSEYNTRLTYVIRFTTRKRRK